MIWLESPANPTLDIVDIGGIADAVHRVRSDILIAVDNTFLTPVMQRPLELGADVVVYSCTKYLCGMSWLEMMIMMKIYVTKRQVTISKIFLDSLG